jgi:tetratricopeptide (TPR) repeat protein
MKVKLIIAMGVALLPAGEWRGLAHEDLAARIQLLTAQLSTNQNNVGVLIQRADIYRLHGNWTEARNDYAAAEKLAPDSGAVLLGQAQLHVDVGEDAAARLAFDEFISRFPTNSVALLSRARVLARLGERPAAIADYSHAIAVAASPQPEEFLERAGLQATEFGADEAIKGLDEGLARLGWVVTFQKAAIDYELKRQRPDQALARLETIIARANRKETWLAWKGEILLAAGRPQEAEKVLSATLKAIETLPPRMRTSPGMVQLRAKVEGSLATLAIGTHVDEKLVRNRKLTDKHVD